MIWFKKRSFLIVFIVILIVFLAMPALADNLKPTVSYLQKTVSKDSYDGFLEWPILAIKGADKDLSKLISKREAQVRQGVMFSTASTDYQRTVVGVVAAGKDPRSFAGRNLIAEVKKSQRANGKFADSISGTGSSLINSHVWGIVSLYVAGETIPNKDKALKWLVDSQNPDGGFSIDTAVKSSDLDLTGMALIAFSALGEDKNHPAVAKVISYLKKQQGDDGDFNCWGGASSESLSQAIQGLVALGIDPAGREWTKNEGNLVSALLAYRDSSGAFRHTLTGKGNTIATYQALIALNDYHSGESIYHRLRKANLRFDDVSEHHFAGQAIRSLAGEGVISGYPDGTFRPGNPVARQEFAKMIVLAANKGQSFDATTTRFKDVPLSSWANPYIKVAVDRKLVEGVSAGSFAPTSKITGAEVMAVLVRSMGLESSAKPAAGESWYDGYVRVAKQKGLLYPGFDATKPVTRAQCAYSLGKLNP